MGFEVLGEISDTESAVEEPHDDIPMQEVPDSHDLRLRRVRRRLRLVWNPETNLAAVEVIGNQDWCGAPWQLVPRCH